MTANNLTAMVSPDKKLSSPRFYGSSCGFMILAGNLLLALMLLEQCQKPMGELSVYYFQTSFDLEESSKLAIGEEDMPEAPEVWTLEDFQEIVPYSEDEK